MPELPEVETIRRGLQSSLVGTRLLDVRIHETRLRRPVSTAALRRVAGRHVASVGRRGKYIVLRYSEGGGLLIHLGMSGRVLLLPHEAVLDRHDHICWRIGGSHGPGEWELRFRDPRRFGAVLARSSGDVATHPVLSRMGPEPFSESFSAGYLRRRALGSRRPVKNMLMDASVVAGLGNIYVCEALWVAGVNPKTRVGRISEVRWTRVRNAILEVLEEAIAQGGTTLSDFRDPSGEYGYFQVRLQAYGKEGRPCERCGGRIRRIVQSGRSSFYCPDCQH